jgi:hypothetical protein
VSSVTVSGLSDIKLPWLVRFRLSRIRKRQGTGVLLYGLIRASARSASKYAPALSVREGTRRLCSCSDTSKFPKWAELPPGAHELRLGASRRISSSQVEANVVLEPGDVMIAVCRPIDAKFWWESRRSADHWYIGVRHWKATRES